MKTLLSAAFALTLLLAGATRTLASESTAAPEPIPAAIGKQFVDAINSANGSALNHLIDVDALSARVLRNLDLNALDQERYVVLLQSRFGLLGYSVAAQMAAQNARAALVRSAAIDTGHEFLVRITTRDAKDNLAHGYLQVQLDPQGRIVDWYDHSLALSMSGQLAFSAASMLTTGEIARMLFGDVDEAIATATGMKEFADLVTAGALGPAHEALLALPPALHERREFATLRATLARNVSITAYRDALADLARRHGDTDDLQLILVDHYLLADQPDRALQAVERAAQAIVDDEVMDANRCHALLELGRKAEALAACDRAIARDPKFETPHWTRVRIGLKTEDAPLAIESLLGVEDAQGKKLKAGWMRKNAAYAWLVTQPEFSAWAAGREDATPE